MKHTENMTSVFKVSDVIRCPICDGKRDRKYPNCFHCSRCWFMECAPEDKVILNMLKGRLKAFRAVMTKIRGKDISKMG